MVRWLRRLVTGVLVVLPVSVVDVGSSPGPGPGRTDDEEERAAFAEVTEVYVDRVPYRAGTARGGGHGSR